MLSQWLKRLISTICNLCSGAYQTKKSRTGIFSACGQKQSLAGGMHHSPAWAYFLRQTAQEQGVIQAFQPNRRQSLQKRLAWPVTR